jgi:hypothetical protein
MIFMKKPQKASRLGHHATDVNRIVGAAGPVPARYLWIIAQRPAAIHRATRAMHGQERVRSLRGVGAVGFSRAAATMAHTWHHEQPHEVGITGGKTIIALRLSPWAASGGVGVVSRSVKQVRLSVPTPNTAIHNDNNRH